MPSGRGCPSSFLIEWLANFTALAALCQKLDSQLRAAEARRKRRNAGSSAPTATHPGGHLHPPHHHQCRMRGVAVGCRGGAGAGA